MSRESEMRRCAMLEVAARKARRDLQERARVVNLRYCIEMGFVSAAASPQTDPCSFCHGVGFVNTNECQECRGTGVILDG